MNRLGFVFIFLIISFQLLAQEKKERLTSGAFTKYDRIIRMNLDQINLDDFIDGPHFFWQDDRTVEMWNIVHKKFDNSMEVRTRKIRVKEDSVWVKGMRPDRNKYLLTRGKYLPQKDEFEKVDTIVVIGDVHGEYDQMLELLQENEIIDQDKNWNFGKAHLVFIGDIFDRGDQVTESFYLIKKLQHQAKQKGGRVHLLFGNHEVMVLMGDSRYASPKYKNLSRRIMKNYSGFYQKDSELGRWIRSLNTVVKINDLIFVHGGLSPQLVEKRKSIQDINEEVRNSFSCKNEMSRKEVMKKVYFPQNPLWYRGYLMRSRSYSIITDSELESVLNFYQAKQIFFGHTEVNEIRFLREKRLVAVNVPMGYADIDAQILLLDKDKMYRCFSDGRRVLVKN